MEPKMRKDLSIKLKPENKFEKHLITLFDMIENGEAEKYINKMCFTELQCSKVYMQYLVKLFKDKIGYIPVVDIK